MDELKPCPLCGTTAEHRGRNELNNAMVACGNIGCALYRVLIAEREWNTRPGEDALCAMINSDVAEFNTGHDAYAAGVPYEDQPETQHDQWRVGWAWAAFEDLRTEVERLRQAVGAYVAWTNGEGEDGAGETLYNALCSIANSRTERA